MHRSLRKVALMAGMLAASPGWAQLQEIVVTGERVSGEDYSRIPAIVMEHRADFLVQRIELSNDTRAAEARAKELHQTLRDMVTDSAKQPGIALSYGDDFLIPITLTSYEVPLDGGGKRPDTSSTDIYVKMSLGAKANVLEGMAALADFIKKARVTGRTEIRAKGDVGLSLVAPEKYRYEIIAKITDDARRLQAAVGTRCKIELSGLANRVSWKRSDVSMLTLYIPYEVQLKDCE